MEQTGGDHSFCAGLQKTVGCPRLISLILLLQQESGRFRFAVVTTFLLTLLIGIGQLFVYGHTAEITDPLRVLLIAMALKAVGGEYSPQRENNSNSFHRSM